VRFTIRGIMIAVAVFGILLPLRVVGDMLVAVLSLLRLSLIGARWLVVRGRRRLASAGSWTLAVLPNILCAARCIAPSVYVMLPLYTGWLLVISPTITGGPICRGSVGSHSLSSRGKPMGRDPSLVSRNYQSRCSRFWTFGKVLW
jgi:hypothetical protein